MTAPVVAVLNMKGGVGKTTISANVFREIFRTRGINTLLIDFDPQHNLSQLLLTRVAYENLRDQRKTLWHVVNPEGAPSVFNISQNDLMRPGPVETYVHRLRYVRRQETVTRDLLP
jgi:chromosome partitioning protein